ncbi:uncharacterized protein FYW49_020716 [Xenentodon cancila]
MWTLFLGVIFGLLASCRSDQLQVSFRSCSIGGVFMAEGTGRHSLDFNTAEKVCEHLESVMASQEQVKEAYDNGMETCRNGWISNGTVAILRHKPHELCAKNMTGFIINSRANASEHFDVYCYDSEVQQLPQRDDQTTDESQDEPEMTTLEDAIYNKTGVFTEKDAQEERTTVAASFYAMLTTMDPEAINEVPERNGNSSGGSNFIPEDLDPAPGSGMLPTSIEEEGGSLVTPSGVLEEAQHPTESEQSPGKPTYCFFLFFCFFCYAAAPQGPNGKGQDSARDDREDNGSSNWLVVIGVIVAVAAILLVCAVVAKRRSWCGRQKTLVITSKDASGGNGAAAASSSHNQDTEQEMVTLMNKENIQENGNTEEFTVIALEESLDKDQQA